MSNLPRMLLENACHHITARGNQKQKVFLEEVDCREYLERLKRYKKKFAFQLYAFCLMPNHIHLLGQIDKGKDLSKFMHGVSLSYTAYFNRKYTKVGHLWQGRFKNKVITKDQYLLDCINYIEVNPVRNTMVNTVSEYPWSSYRERVFGDGIDGVKMLDQLAV
ncbi:transposase [Candidatus Omnitrophota bacterium]